MFHLLAITAGSDGSSNFFGDAPEVAVGLELHMTLKGKICDIKISWAEAVSLHAILLTTIKSIMNAKVSQQRFWHCHENRLIKTIQTIPYR